MLDSLDRDDRMRLVKFVCSFAWADLEVHDAEREFIKKLVRQLELDASEKQQVEEWLEMPPRAEELDPAEIPRAHRELFLDTAKALIVSDGVVERGEAESLALLDLLVQ